LQTCSRDPAHSMIRDYLRRFYRLILPLLYGRKRFKLFQNAALGYVSMRMLTLASLTDYFAGFVRPIPIKAPFGKSALIVAPHQDDEAIGCGGALILQLRSGHSASVVMLHDGAGDFMAYGLSREAFNEKRNEESRRAAASVGMEAPHFLNYRSLADHVTEAAADVRGIINERKVDALFVPFVLDAHPDHRTANRIVAEALKGISWNVRVLGYEVWGLCIPNVVVVIDDVIEDKMRMIECFSLANSAIDYVHSTRGLNMFHSRMLGAGQCRYAERFFELPRQEYIELVEQVRTAETMPEEPVASR